ncbi:MAG TPA: hypothetical protein VHX62_08790 [Solirubrobacteraceae bacterium]|nr:hypothetical protein [Solirubrobacteraceae bacterium]
MASQRAHLGRRLPRGVLLAVLGVLAALAGGAGVAHAATPGRSAGRGRSTPADGVTAAGVRSKPPAPRAQLGALAQITGLHATQVTAAAACPPARPGHARCAAQALVLRSSRRFVRPRVRARASFTQVFPRRARGIVPAAASAAAAGPPQAGTPAYLQQAYDLTYLSQTAGGSDTVAIVDADDDPYAESDLATYRATYGLPACTTANGCFAKVNEHGAAAPLPTADSGWETEISLDLDAVSALCPNCHILLVEANSTGLSDMDAAVVTAAGAGARQISASWSTASSSPISGTYTFPGVAVVAATGDSGYDGPGSDAYPAALPGVTAAGGTTLSPSTSSAPSPRGFTESAWSLGGGWGGGSGCDVAEAKPAYQSDAGCTGRSYSDVSADANPTTGLVIYDSGSGGWMLAGGTSLATPLIAAFDAVTGIGSTPQWAYADSALLNDPTAGSNGACAAAIAYICNARVGYDGPTGVGSISGDVVPGAPGIGGASIGSGTSNTYAQGVSAGGATLAGGVYPNGLTTTYSWQYGTSTGYGQQTPATAIAPGAGPAAATTALAGLAAGTIYHYRLVAQNADGVSYGYDETFTTAAGAPGNTGAPAIAGTARVGQALTAAAGTWSPSGTVTYQWKRSTRTGWSSIARATGPRFTPVSGDVGDRIEVVVSAANPFGATSAVSAAVGPLAAAPVARATRKATAGRLQVTRSTSRASAVVSRATRALRTSRGVRLAVARVAPVLAQAASRGRRKGAPTARRMLVRRSAGVTGTLRAWACAAPSARPARAGACTAPVRLRSSVALTLPAFMRGGVWVVVARG